MVTVAGGTPTLTLNDGGTATYVSGSGTNTLTFSYTVGAGQSASSLAATAVNLNTATISDGAGNAANLSLSGLTQNGPQIDTTTPAVTSISESPSTGDLGAGKTVTLSLSLSEVVTVAGGTPTLTLNDGGTATYVSGSGTNTLTFSYTVGAGQSASSLAATAVNLNTATISDGAGNAANLSLSGLTQHGPQIDTTTPTISSLTESPSSGDLGVGKTVTLTLSLSEVVTVTGGTPTLTLNDGGTATYVSGSGTNTLTFSYTVGAGQSASSLAATAVNLNTATISDGAGNAANLSLSGLTQNGPQIDGATPVVTSISESPSSGDLNAGKVVTITLDMSEVVTVNTTGGTPTLSLNDGGTATYVGGSGTGALTFSYTVQAGQNTSDLTETAVNLNGAAITDGAGNAANLSLAGLPQGSPQIDTTMPTVSSLTESPSSGVLGVGKTVTFTLTLSEVVMVSGGTPTLTLDDGGTATYVSGSGTNTLIFSYTIGAGQNTAGLAATAVNLNSATVADGAGNAANLSLSGLIQQGPQVNIPVFQIDEGYQAVLQHSPTTAEMNGSLSIGASLGAAMMITAIVDAPEAQQSVYPVVQIIDLATGNLPTAAQLSAWVLATESGISLDQMAIAFVGSTAFGNIYNNGTAVDPNSPITASIVEAIIQHATGVAATSGQVNAWVASAQTVDQVFVDFALGEQFTAASQSTVQQYLTTEADSAAGIPSSNTLNTTSSSLTASQITEIYQVILQRAPTSAEVNAAISENSVIGNAGVVAVVVDSPEAQQNIYPIVQIIDLATGNLPTTSQLAAWVLVTESGISLDQMATAFVASTAFGDTYNNGTPVNPDAPITASIVEDIIQHATGVTATQAQANAWVSSGLSIDQVFVDFSLGAQYSAAIESAVQDYLAAAAINGAGLTTINGVNATGGLTLGTSQTPMTGDGLIVLGGAGALTVVASGVR